MKAVILSAGCSTRFWPLNLKPKFLIKIMGKPLIFYTIKGLRAAKIKEIIIVQGPKREVEEELKNYDFGVKIKYLIQREARGMGEALYQTKKLIKDRFFLLNAERVDGGEIVKKIKIKAQKIKSKTILVGEKTNNPQLFGIMRINNDRVLDVIEKPKKKISNIKVAGVYLLEPKFLEVYQRVRRRNLKNIYNFEKALSVYLKKNDVRALILGKDKNYASLTLKYPWHLFRVEKYLFDNYLKSKIEREAKIFKNVQIEGRVYIGKEVKIFEGTTIRGPCYIGDNCVIGNNSLIRDYTDLENNVLIGAFAEATRSIFQESTHTHSGFFGDSIFDKNCWLGAGTITANKRLDKKEIKVESERGKIKTGIFSFGTVIGENTKVGINSSLMPGTLIGPYSLIGPHSLVKGVIKEGTVFYSKLKEVIKKNGKKR